MSDSTPPVPKVYMAMSNVLAIISEHGIGKNRENTQQKYKFRGIDDIYNCLSNSLAKEKLLIIPRVMSRTVTERETKLGGALFYVVVEMEFDFLCAIDGSKVTARMSGEAMDTADKATNKAQSAAYKYVCLQTFCIPTEGMPGEGTDNNDADAVTHPTIQPANKKATPAPGAAPAAATKAPATPAATPKATPAAARTTPPAAQAQVVDKVPPSARPAQTPVTNTAAKMAVPSIPDWRVEIVHFGKRQGVPLGDLEEASLLWFIQKWDPNAKPGITPSAADVRLRRALDIAGASMALPGFGTPPPPQDEIPGL